MHFDRTFIDSFGTEAMLLPSSRNIAPQQYIKYQHVVPALGVIDHPLHTDQLYIIFKVYPKSLKPYIEIFLACSHAVLADDAIDEMSICVEF